MTDAPDAAVPRRGRGRRAASRLAGAALLALVAGPAAAAGFDPACAGPPVAAGRIGADRTPPGTARPVVGLQPDGAGPAAAVLDGLVVPAVPADRAALSQALAALTGTPVAVRAARLKLDRRGRAAGLLVTADGRVVQAALLAAGLALVDGEATPCAAGLAAAEAEARSAGRGLWAPGGARREADDAAAAGAGLPDFVVASGFVRSVGRSGSTTYLNFGDRWSDDFTVRIGGSVATALAAAGRDPARLAGRRVLVRGFAAARDGVDLSLASGAAIETDGAEAW